MIDFSINKLLDWKNSKVQGISLAVVIFLLVTFLLTFNVISKPNLVIGDNFQWTPQNILDITGPKVVRESYMGDIAVISAFKTGFLFPITYIVVSLNLPSTFVYPALFYFLSMLTFYFLAKEFLDSNIFRILVSILYVINPVTPYYFASLINAFSLVLLPLALKFFVRTIKDIQESSSFIKNMVFAAFFIALTVSANEQFVLSVLLLAAFMTVTLTVVLYKKSDNIRKFTRSFLLILAVLAAVFLLVNLPLFLSTGNIQKAPWSTYFQGPSSSRFLTTVSYTYRTADLPALLRLGGDSGNGLGQTSWYDSSSLTNVFGYLLLVLFVASVLILVLKKDTIKVHRAFFYQAIGLFILTVILILLVKSLPYITGAQNASLDSLLKTWETPSKLRVVLLLSMLVTSFIAFGKLSLFSKKNEMLSALIVTLILLSTVAYNSPWLINYAGQTTLQEVADASNWGSLYNQEYANISDFIGQQAPNDRGIVIPYTHKTELYASPNSRIFQIVSQVSQQTAELTPPKNVPWSQTLGMFSIKTVAVKNTFNSNEVLIFPSPINVAGNNTVNEIKHDPGFEIIDQANDYTIYNNQNALPTLYASNNYVFYDNVGTLKYAFNYADFRDLPVFLKSESDSGLFIPSYINQDNYRLYAIELSKEQAKPNLFLNVDNHNSSGKLILDRTNDFQNLTVYSSTYSLSPNEKIEVPEQIQTQHFPDSTLNSSSMSLGNFGSFTLDLKVNVLQNGNYSFLGPRVLIDDGTEKYYLIIHDNGMLELAIMNNGVFQPAMSTSYVGYSLLNPNNSINVRVQRVFDQVKVYVQGNLCMTFTTEPKFSNISLTSEHSTSAFTNINMTENSSVRLFAIRQNPIKISYTSLQSSAGNSAITVYNNGSDLAIISQYLYTNLSHVNNNINCSEVQANIFFKAWIFNHTNIDLNGTKITISTENGPLTLVSTGFAIAFSYLMLLILITPLGEKAKILFKHLQKQVKEEDHSE